MILFHQLLVQKVHTLYLHSKLSYIVVDVYDIPTIVEVMYKRYQNHRILQEDLKLLQSVIQDCIRVLQQINTEYVSVSKGLECVVREIEFATRHPYLFWCKSKYKRLAFCCESCICTCCIWCFYHPK